MAPQQTPPPPLPSPLSVERGGGERGACHVCRVARNGAVASAPLSVIESGYKKPSPVGCSPGTAAYVEPPPPPPSSRRQRVVGAIREGDASCHYAPNKSALSGIRGFPSLSPPPTAYPPNPSSLPRSLENHREVSRFRPRLSCAHGLFFVSFVCPIRSVAALA